MVWKHWSNYNLVIITFFFLELRSQISWDSNWIHFLDALIQLPTAYEMEKRGELVVPVSIQSICINPLELNNQEFDGKLI